MANKSIQLVCSVIFPFTVFACLITFTIWTNLACWWILSMWADWTNSVTFCILCHLTVSAVCNFFSFTVSLLVWLFSHLSYLSWLCFLFDKTLTLSEVWPSQLLDSWTIGAGLCSLYSWCYLAIYAFSPVKAFKIV